MARYEVHREFLNNLAKSKNPKNVLNRATDEEIKTLLELFINIDAYISTSAEQDRFKKHKNIIKRIVTTQWSLKRAKIFLLKHSKLVSLLTVSFLAKLLEGLLCSVLLQDGDV